jgi:hypothetical protein
MINKIIVMKNITVIRSKLFNEIVDANKEQDTFFVKNMENVYDESSEYWLALYFHAPENATIAGSSDRLIHQNWELLGPTRGRDNKTGEVSKFYIFEFVGSHRHDTMKYNGEKILVYASNFHNVLIEECEEDSSKVRKINNSRGLKDIVIDKIPNMSGYKIFSVEN